MVWLSVSAVVLLDAATGRLGVVTWETKPTRNATVTAHASAMVLAAPITTTCVVHPKVCTTTTTLTSPDRAIG